MPPARSGVRALDFAPHQLYHTLLQLQLSAAWQASILDGSNASTLQGGTLQGEQGDVAAQP